MKKRKNMKWPWPKPFWRGKETHALKMLRSAAAEGGLPHPYMHRGRGWATTLTLQEPVRKLNVAGLIEAKRSGPRGGERWHATELGLAYLAVSESCEPGPAMDAAFLLIKP